jgi:uncharacterized protein (TIGR02646 family)
MIRIDKPDEAPDKLRGDGREERAQLEAKRDDDPEAFSQWIQSDAFKRSIFSHDSVREALLEAQHEKCAYCEKGREHVHEVEHYRPKKAVRQSTGEERTYPGYYWLAYEWANLLMACRHCNGRKGTLFPLDDPADRARSHHDDLADENPLLIQPDREDPSDHLTFREHVVVAKTPKGERTRDVLGLNRERLKNDRREAYEMLRGIHQLTQLGTPESAEAEALLERRAEPDAEFSAMVQAAIDDSFTRP